MVFNLRLALGRLCPQIFWAHSLGLPILPRALLFSGSRLPGTRVYTWRRCCGGITALWLRSLPGLIAITLRYPPSSLHGKGKI